jgi:aminoglycoside/choline kinase family phosphotransferase
MKEITIQLKNLFEAWASEKVLNIYPLAKSGSYRQYFRIIGIEKIAIGVFNPDKNENRTFISFTKHFLKKDLSVPKIYSQNLKDDIYLLEDLGDITLFSLIEKEKQNDSFSTKIVDYYKDALTHLIRFQLDGGKGLDYSVCYPRAKFDKQSILWDLNYFKYYFLKMLKIPFDEQKLETDFNTFSDFLLSADTKYFMYRDFQSRNILVRNNQLYFVDYQGGRKGALQYDVASLLFQAKNNLSKETRTELLSFYLDQLNQRKKVNQNDFKKYYYGYVLIRLLQTLGAYGFRGYYENKTHFLLSIPYALKNLRWLVDEKHIPGKLPELKNIFVSILKNEELKKLDVGQQSKQLKVTINSFSYKDGIPKDFSGNGGGFVFDCRSLENPGRYPQYKDSTGLDENVIIFLREKNDVKEFLNSIFSIIDESVKNYINREFKDLMINFGCTGGQHRSVYCAESLARHLKENFNVAIEINHIQLNKRAGN